MIWLYLIIGLLIGVVICYLVMRPKYILDQETLQKNEELKKTYGSLNAAVASAETAVEALEHHKASLNQDIANISAQAKATTDEIYKKSYDLMQEHMSLAAEQASDNYRKAEKIAQKEYLDLLEENERNLSELCAKISQKWQELSELKDKTSAAIAADKRRALEKDEKNFYRIKISEDEMWDIEILRKVVKELKCDPTAINKVIWEVYYKKPTQDLLNRITPTGSDLCGIYKVTNEETGQCYVGQSVDLRTRIRDHIKAGLGINSSNNRFYLEMRNIGPEQFTYEIIEHCDRSKLNERERFWIDYYKATEWGYNSTQGNKNGEK